MQSKMTDCCAATNCGSDQGKTDSDVTLFSFPSDPDRCKQWLDNCHRPDLASKGPEELHKLYKLCAKHFEPSLISHEGTSDFVLKEDAVPTVFEDTEPSTIPTTTDRKRAGDPLEEEPASVKKSKENTESHEVHEESEVSGQNSTTCVSLPRDDPMQEDTAGSKARESLKVYFKEVLALTGFSINGTNIDEPMMQLGESRGRPELNPICVEKIDQKEILQFSEDLMRDEIQNSLQMARFFSILLQDATNMEGKEQIPVFVRSVTVEGFPQKHLIGFLPCELDTENLFYTLLTELRNKWGLRMEHCRGLSYLVTGGMCQKIRDLTCRILQEFPQVVLSPSDPYVFNIWIIRCMPVPFIQSVADAVEEVAGLIRRTPELSQRLEGKIQMTYGHVKGRVDGIKEACRGNWEYRTDAFQTMLDILEPFLNVINEVISKVDEDTAEQLAKLRPTLKNFNFIVTLVVLKNTLCCVSILNSSLRGIISISSTLQYTISNALKLVTKYQQEIAIFHRKWFGDAMGRAKKLGVEVTVPEPSLAALAADSATATDTPLEDMFRENLSRPILQYLVAEVKRVFSVEMVRILRWLSLVPSYMADHNFSIRRDKVADANLNNLARPDTFYEELGCWELKWRHASKRRILPTTVFATLKIQDIGFYPNVQSLLRVLGTVPCVNAEADVYGQYNMVLERCQFYLKGTPPELRRCHLAYVFVNQDVHFNVEQMVETYAKTHPEIMQLLQTENAVKAKQPKVANDGNHVEKDNEDESKPMTIEMEGEKLVELKCAETDREALKSALQAAVTAAYNSQSRQNTEVSAEQESEVSKYVSKSEMKEVLNVCENTVRDGILLEVGSSFFSLFIDRVVTLGEKDYLPLFLRFVDSFDVMRLELMGFAEADLECDAMVKRLLEILTVEWRLDLKYCRGQAYLGSGDISYKLKAFACKVQEKSPLAISTHSSCYSFNTWWSKTIPVPAITKALEVFEEVLVFFGSSSLLEKQVDHVIAYGLRESYEKVQELQGKFCSLWQEKHDSYEVFVQIMEPLVECLEKIKNNPQRWKESLSEQAGSLLRKIMDFDFIIAMVILKNTSSFTKELSAGLQKDHFSAASQLCQISGILATLSRVKTNMKVFHQNWFDEACAVAQSLRVQVEEPECPGQPRDAARKPLGYFKDALSVPLMDNLMTAVKDHFSEDHKEALNFLSLVPCSVTVSYMFESLKSKPPLYSTDLPDADNFFTELCCWRVKWKTKVTLTIPDTIFHTLRLPVMQYFGNINTLLRIMSVLPSTALEDCGAKMRHKLFQEFLKNTEPKDRTPCLAMLQVGTDFNRDLDRMVTQCLKVTPQTLEGICLDKESKTLMKNSENNMEVDHLKDEAEEVVVQPPVDATDEQPAEENGHTGDNQQSLETVFRLAAQLAKKNGALAEITTDETEGIVQELGLCRWLGADGRGKLNMGETEIAMLLTKGIRDVIRDVILQEIQESPFFSLVTDRPVRVADGSHLPVFVRYVGGSAPKVELLGFLPFDESSVDDDGQAKALAKILTEDWGLPMSQCRGQAYMRSGSGCQSLKIMALDFLKSYPLSVVTPSESCGLAYWLAGCVPCPPVTRMLDVAEDLLRFFDRSPGLEAQLAQAVDGLLNAPMEALEESPETCCSRWKRRDDFFDALADTLEGVLSCLDAVSAAASVGTTALYAQVLATAVRSMDFIVALVILRNACAPLRNCSTVFRCGNPADIIGEAEKIPQIIEALSKMLENIGAVHGPWFEHAFQLASKLGPEQVCFPEEASNYESVEIYYRETLSIPVLKCLIEEMKHSFSESHLQALSVLSLLPSCNPQSSLESTDKPFGAYLTDLTDPDTAEMEINAWAVAWREKYQEAAPPASISETLLHPEALSHPTVTSLLRLVAVLPSVSIECDLMRSSLNAMRDLLEATVCRGSRTERVMLLMHQQTLRRLPELIQRCMEMDPESRPCLAQVLETFRGLKLIKGAAIVESMEEEPSGPAVADPPADAVAAPQEGNGVPLQEALPEALPGPRGPVSFYGPQLREEMLKELWDSQFFTIIMEQAAEVDGELYVPLCLRYLNKEDIQCEETLAFIPCHADAGALADAVETALSEKWGLNMAYCRGLALLSVGQAGAQMRAVCASLAAKYPQAVRAVSSAVSLNVWLARSSPVPEAADAAALTENLLTWFTADARRQNRLEDAILGAFPRDEARGHELRDKLVKSWERSHDMQELTAELLEPLMLCLNDLKDEGEGGGAAERQQAGEFFDAVRRFEFLFATVVGKHVLAATGKLSASLQGKPLDMLLAVDTLPDLNEALGKLRCDVDVLHKAWFQEAVALAARLQVPTLHPVLLEPLSDFYAESVSGRAIEHSVAEVADLFAEKVLDTLRALEIVPYAMSRVETPTLGGLLFRLYSEDLPDKVSLFQEIKSWKEKWLDPLAGYLPTTVLDTLKTSQIRSFSNIETLLRLQVVLPFSRKESSFRVGKRSLQAFMLQQKRSLAELHPL
ncbi:uncharacterized protein si:dkey-250d21.1 isoform X2 [Gadus morhua]|uniref:uncharacterized protein si:dkey-250d21.1 isoform X2 n=1 Tax=Gadus morhua TaxID=8049 RepID=UPI0011B616B5|nr:uncharacterized protein LOC115547024 isoform X2 [Gadus morhua]